MTPTTTVPAESAAGDDPHPDHDGEAITLTEAAETLGVHYMTAYRYVRTGRLAAHKVGTQWYVKPTHLAAFSPGRRAAGTVSTSSSVEQLLSRLIVGDQAGCWKLCEDLLAGGASVTELYLDLITPAMTEIGERWATGDLTVSEEHLASAITQRILGRLGPQFNRPGIKRGTVIIGAPEGDYHGLPTALMGDLLRGRGYDVIDLGANTPGDSFAQVARVTERVIAIGLAVSAPSDQADARGTISTIRSAELGVPIVAGGGQISGPSAGEALGADFGSADVAAFLALIDELANERAITAVG